MDIPQIALLHLIVGTVTVLAGALALISKKGRILHRFSGNLFFACMLLLCLSGLYLSFSRSITFTIYLALLAIYLVATGWVAVKRRDGAIGLFETMAMLAIFLAGLACAISGILTPTSPAAAQDVPPAGAYYVLAALAMFFGVLDVHVVRRGGVAGKHRIARHLWRMCFAMFIAVTIFFLGNSNVLPEFLQDPGLLNLPILAVVILMIFWLCRVLLTNWWAPAHGNRDN